MAFLAMMRDPNLLRAEAARLCRAWAVQTGRVCLLVWAPQCADPAPEPERWDWSVPYRWYEASR